MKEETPQQRAYRKATFIARATSHFDTPKIRKEAEELFEKNNETNKKARKETWCAPTCL